MRDRQGEGVGVSDWPLLLPTPLLYYFLDQRARAAFCAMAFLRLGLNFAALAFPPLDAPNLLNSLAASLVSLILEF